MKSIGVVTTSRADYGLYRPILRRMQDDPRLQLHLIASGTHLVRSAGMTSREIESDGFRIADRVEALLASDSPEAIAKAAGVAAMGFAQVFSRAAPDLVLVLGDRYEMHAAALAALPFRIPVAHVHGGELTEGAIDDALRHSMTKLSHLHFASTAEYARRIVQMGEAPWRVVVSGAPGLDNLEGFAPLEWPELCARFALRIEPRYLLVTYHPVTLEYDDTEHQITGLFTALERASMPILFTMPNRDTWGGVVREGIERFVARHPRSQAVETLGTEGYYSAMSHAAAMVGNSSSGIVEAASFHLPVVNVGNRQAGRVRGENVVDVGYGADEIADGIATALSDGFRRRASSAANPYYAGGASARIVETLAREVPRDRLLRKLWHRE